MDIFTPEHRSKDGITYVYVWNCILAAGCGASPPAHVYEITGVSGTLNRPATDMCIGYKVVPTFDVGLNAVVTYQMPPGTDLEAAKKWIESDPGKAFAKGATLCFLSFTSVLQGTAK